MSFAGVTVFPAIAAAASDVHIDTINGHAPDGYCVTGPITITGSGITGTNGGPYSVDIGWGAGNGTTTVSLGNLGAHGAAFTFTAGPHTVGTSLTLFLHHSTANGQDEHTTVVNLCAAAPTQGVVILAKHVVNDNGGSAAASAFTLTINGTSTIGAEAGMAPGFLLNGSTTLGTTNFAITESGPANYTRTKTECFDGTATTTTNGTTGSVTVVAGKTYKCTITNDDNAPTLGGLVIVKNVVNTGGGLKSASDFAISVKSSGTDVAGSPAAGVSGAGREYTLSAGSYVVSEPTDPHYTSSISGTNCTGGNATVSVRATTTCTVTNTYQNAAPTADNQTLNTNEDVAISGTATGADSDSGDVFTFGFLSAPSHGTLTSPLNPTTGAFTYTPAANFFGTDSFTFNTTDGVGTSAAATVTINVASVNDNPVAQNDTLTVNQDAASTTVSVLGNDSDVDGDTLTVTTVGAAGHGTTDTDGTTATYKPAAGYVGTDSFTYTISDGHGGTASATVNVIVSNVEEAPTANADSYPATEDTQLNVAAPGVLGNDTDPDAGDTLTAIKVTDPSHGTLTLNSNGSFSYTPAANYCGTDSFTYKANDGQMDSSTVTVTITIACVNDAPVAQNGTIDTDQNAATSSNLVATDVEGSALTYDVVVYPTHGFFTSFASSTGAFTYSPNFGFLGADSFTFKANDGSADSNVATVSINVHPVTENTFAKCTDTIDNDGDHLVDLADPDCAQFLPQIVIVKHTIGADGTFHFVVTDGESTASTTNVTTSEGSGSSASIAVQPGSYIVTETVTAGWDFNNSSCAYTNPFEQETNAIGTALPETHSEQLDTLGAGDVVTCTFTNTIIPTNADVSVVKTVNNSNPAMGDQVTYTLTAHNAGPATATGVVVTDALPSGVTYVSDTGADTYSTSTNQWTVGTLSNGQNAVLMITVSVNTGTLGSTITNTANVSANNADTNEDNNASSVSISVGKDLCPNIEGVQLTIPAGKVISGPDCVDNVPTTTGGGGGGGGNGPIWGGGSNGPIGQVLGASTSLPELPAGCVALLSTYMRSHNHKNDSSEVKKLQAFLNGELGLNIPVSGVFGPLTEAGVNKFQAKYQDQVLTPWNLSAPTGFVYRTTQRWVNLIHCKDLNIPLPVNLTPYHHEDQQ